MKQGGTISLFWNKHVKTDRSDGFSESVQRVYEHVAPSMARNFPGFPHPDEIALPVQDELARSGLFGEVTVRKYRWEQEFGARAYVQLLGTYSDHLGLEAGIRDQLFERIEGDTFTIMGLPMLPLLEQLRKMGAIDG